jgi:hypothetical protein
MRIGVLGLGHGTTLVALVSRNGAVVWEAYRASGFRRVTSVILAEQKRDPGPLVV